MKRAVAALLLVALAPAIASASPLVFIVRHAEKAGAGKDPDLSEAGRKRADALAVMLKDAGVTAIFVTEFKRTQETAAPLAQATHVTPTVLSGNDTAGLVAKLRSSSGTVLVVGHGNTIPALINALGIATPVSVADDDYTEIFVVSLNGSPQLSRLHYPF